jgi:transcriptional regulator with XRE-family HTH domain
MGGMATGTELGHFLRSRRAALSPADVGITSYGSRRVPGLRREELAQLAGVSATYYTRLEQGQSPNASEAVIDAVGRALGLDDDERAHLHDLARPVPARRRRAPRPDVARPETRQLIEAMAGVPAVVVGRRTEVLAWNPLGHLLLAGHHAADAPDRPTDRPNLTRMLFLDPHTRDLYRRWDEEAARAVASLRLLAGRHADDRELAELVGELSMKSADFARLWSRHPVQNCTRGTKYFQHPAVGPVDLAFEVLHLPDDSGHRMLLYSAEPGSASDAALRLLAAPAEDPYPVGCLARISIPPRG